VAVAIGAVTNGALGAGASATATISFTSTTQPLYVVVPHFRNARTLNTVTFGGVALTRVVQSSASNGDDAVEIWRLLAPSASTANVVLTFSGLGAAGRVAIFNTTGQDTAGTPEGNTNSNASAAAGTGTGNLALTGAATGDLIITGVTDGGGAAITPAATGGGTVTEIMDVAQDGQESEAFTVADAATAVSATFSSNSWAIAAIVLKATPAGPQPISAGSATWDFPHPPIRTA
jgi:hypothetical protein